jgi:hypothetical protein
MSIYDKMTNGSRNTRGGLFSSQREPGEGEHRWKIIEGDLFYVNTFSSEIAPFLRVFTQDRMKPFSSVFSSDTLSFSRALFPQKRKV